MHYYLVLNYYLQSTHQLDSIYWYLLSDHSRNFQLYDLNLCLYHIIMIVSIAIHYDRNFGPKSQEPIARARCYLAEWMFLHTKYQTNFNREAIKLFKLPKTKNTSQKFTTIQTSINTIQQSKIPTGTLCNNCKFLMLKY